MNPLPPRFSSVAALTAAFFVSALAGLRAAETAAAHQEPAKAGTTAAAARPSPDAALQRLIEGNRRFVAGQSQHPNQSVARRTELAGGQAPFAVVVTCSDSRVSPELYFDQGLGDLFVVRDAGNVLNDHVIGSIEYAVEHLHASVIIVVGHSKCGAVAATLAGGNPGGHIGSIVESIRPAVTASSQLPGDKLTNAIKANAELGAAALKASNPILSHAVQSGQIKVYAATYDLASGRVELAP